MIASVGSQMAKAVSRNFSTSLMRASERTLPPGHRGHWPKPGSNLPFDINNRYKLTLYFMLFTGSAFGLPFYLWVQKS